MPRPVSDQKQDAPSNYKQNKKTLGKKTPQSSRIKKDMLYRDCTRYGKAEVQKIESSLKEAVSELKRKAIGKQETGPFLKFTFNADTENDIRGAMIKDSHFFSGLTLERSQPNDKKVVHFFFIPNRHAVAIKAQLLQDNAALQRRDESPSNIFLNASRPRSPEETKLMEWPEQSVMREHADEEQLYGQDPTFGEDLDILLEKNTLEKDKFLQKVQSLDKALNETLEINEMLDAVENQDPDSNILNNVRQDLIDVLKNLIELSENVLQKQPLEKAVSIESQEEHKLWTNAEERSSIEKEFKEFSEEPISVRESAMNDFLKNTDTIVRTVSLSCASQMNQLVLKEICNKLRQSIKEKEATVAVAEKNLKEITQFLASVQKIPPRLFTKDRQTDVVLGKETLNKAMQDERDGLRKQIKAEKEEIDVLKEILKDSSKHKLPEKSSFLTSTLEPTVAKLVQEQTTKIKDAVKNKPALQDTQSPKKQFPHTRVGSSKVPHSVSRSKNTLFQGDKVGVQKMPMDKGSADKKTFSKESTQTKERYSYPGKK